MATNQRKVLSELGIKALIGGTIACFLTAAIAGMLITDYGIESVAEQEPVSYTTVSEMTNSFEFFGLFGNPDTTFTAKKSSCFYSNNDSTVSQLQYQDNLFEEHGSYIVPKSIDFKTSTQNIAIQSADITLNADVTIESLKQMITDETAFANVKEGSGTVNVLQKVDGSYYQLTFENEKLVSLSRLYQCD